VIRFGECLFGVVVLASGQAVAGALQPTGVRIGGIGLPMPTGGMTIGAL